MSADLIQIVYELLPGFMAAWIFFALTAHPRRNEFERIVQALIFTGFVKAVVTIIQQLMYGFRWMTGVNFGVWDQDLAFVLSTLVALFLGLLFTWLANTNCLHKKIPEWISKRTSYPSEWFSAFNNNKLYVYLHLTGDRRIWGWAEEWPDTPGSGHFVLAQAQWVLDDNTRAPLYLTERILIPATEVVMVEFEKQKEAFDFSMEDQNRAEKILVDLRKNAPKETTKNESEATPQQEC